MKLLSESLPNEMMKNHITEVNNALKKALKNDKAYLEIKLDGNFCHIILHLGLKGPVNSDYINEVVICEILDELPNIQMSSNKTERLTVKILNLSSHQNEEQVAIEINHLPLKWFYNKDSHSLLFYLQNYIKKRDSIQSDKYQASLNVYNDLSQAQLTNKYKNWTVKEKGMLDGIILVGKTKLDTTKKIYVKTINTTEEALDNLIFTIVKICGVSVPKTKIKKTLNRCYLFSTSIDKRTTKFPNTEYCYSDLIDYLKCASHYVNFNELKICLNREPDGSFKETLVIDKKSIASLLLATVIFGLYDLSASNIGILISCNNFIKCAKLALIDFKLSPNHSLEEIFDSELSLKENIQNYLKTLTGIDRASEFLIACESQLCNEDYYEAFELIAINLNRVCTESINDLEKLFDFLEIQYAKWFIKYVCENWQKNCNYLINEIGVLSDSLTFQLTLNNNSI